MELDELFDDRQAEPEAAVAARGRRIRLTEAIEDVRQECRIHAFTVVGDFHDELRTGTAERDGHEAILLREFHGIGQEVPEHLLQAIRIASDETGLRLDCKFELNAFGLRRWPDGI